MVRVAPLLVVVALACRYEPPGGPTPPTIPEPKFSAACEALMPMRVGHSARPPRVVFKAPPRDAGVKGIVIVGAIVDASGRICDAVVVRGLTPAADREALATIRRWRFEPAEIRGEPHAAVFYLTVKF